jgi:hemolysin III
MRQKFREPISGFSHMFGALLSIVGLLLLLINSFSNGGLSHVLTFTVFGLSLILLYSASTVYHLVTISERAIQRLRRVDHSMIYVLIAGTYTPVCLIALRGRLGWGLFIAIWSLALLGIALKLCWMNAPRWLYTSFYVFMGWISIFIVAPLTRIIAFSGVMWLFAGGVMYTLGAVIYALKWPRINSKIFGFHEIFHIFVLAGSFCHYWVMFRYIMNL